MTRRARKAYFETEPGAPAPLQWDVSRRVRFSEVDALGIVWHGRYAGFFEEASAELGRRCGLSYRDFYEAGLYAPIVQLHIDYFQPLRLDEEFAIRGRLHWCEGARLNSEYELIKVDGTLAARAFPRAPSKATSPPRFPGSCRVMTRWSCNYCALYSGVWHRGFRPTPSCCWPRPRAR